MVRTYPLVETATGKDKKVGSSVPQGLKNCKALSQNIFAGEEAVHLICNNLDDLNTRILNIAKKDGVEKINRRLTAVFSEGPSSSPSSALLVVADLMARR